MRFRSLLVLASLALAPLLRAQTANLRDVNAEGMKILSSAQVVQLTGLHTNTQVGRKELQDAADLLVASGLFAKVSYNFKTQPDGVAVTYVVQENSRLPAYYDNFPWYSDSELNDAIKRELPFFDGTLPQGGTVLELASQALANFVTAGGLQATVEHQVLANPLSDTSVIEFRLVGVSPRIASVEFADPALRDNRAVQQHLPELVGKPYSRLSIDLFLAEAIRPVYLQQGFLRSKIGPAEVRLSGNPNQKLPEQIPVFVPSTPGPVFQWKGVDWSGNSALSTITLTNAVGMKTGDVVDGMALEAAWDKVRDEYGHLGYLDVKLTPQPHYDESAHTVSYSVQIVEGQQFHYSSMTITGMSVAGERLIHEAWPQKTGDVFDKTLFNQLLARLESRRDLIFHGLPLHYDTVGHWLQTDPSQGTVDILLDFK